ncbi:acyl-CoA dehydrogenase family protein [Mumia sp. DW29H23]|uniref:acyl-CoA dehydrogenase family protein n=1 Tax=Mumia sp. DW29H23 TaxID=3421241 RepID=UPI003D698382
MNFAFDDEQIALADSVRRLLDKQADPVTLRALWGDADGRSPNLWDELAASGLPSILVPEDDGGAGGDLVDLVLVLEEVGQHAVPDALVEALVVGPVALVRGASAEVRDTWLPAVAAGERRLTAALRGLDSVPDAHVSDGIVAVVGDDLLLLARDEVDVEPLRSMDPSRRQSRVTIRPGADPVRLDADPALVQALLAYEAVASAAVLIGLSRQMLDLTVEYVKVRRQFDRVVGSFQAVKHQLAHATSLVTMARLVVQAAAWTTANEGSDALDAARSARVCALDAEFEANRVALQLHGGIGFTWEHDLQLWLKLGKSLEQAHGGRNALAGAIGTAAVAGTAVAS